MDLDYLLHIYMYMFPSSFTFTHVINAKHHGANHLRVNQNRSEPSQGETCIGAKHPIANYLVNHNRPPSYFIQSYCVVMNQLPKNFNYFSKLSLVRRHNLMSNNYNHSTQNSLRLKTVIIPNCDFLYMLKNYTYNKNIFQNSFFKLL